MVISVCAELSREVARQPAHNFPRDLRLRGIEHYAVRNAGKDFAFALPEFGFVSVFELGDEGVFVAAEREHRHGGFGISEIGPDRFEQDARGFALKKRWVHFLRVFLSLKKASTMTRKSV